MAITRRHLTATAGLGGLALVTLLLLGGLWYFGQADSMRKFGAWRMGGTYLGTEGVVLQDKANNCGPAALQMALKGYGIVASLRDIEQDVQLTREGSSMFALQELATSKGLRAEGWRLTMDDLTRSEFPVVVFVDGDHFAVVDSIGPSGEVFLRDPAVGRIRMPRDQFEDLWDGRTLLFAARK